MAKVTVFDWDALSTKQKGTKAAEKAFARTGADVASVSVDPKVKRAAGVKYKEMLITFSDSQMVTLRIKDTGDVFQVLVNGKVVPIRNQDDHPKAVAEIAGMLEAGRSAFQAKLAKAKVKLPGGTTTAVPNIEKALTEKRDALVEAVGVARTTLEGLQAELAG
jgi:predicted Rdx family selenoprotein